MKYFVLKPGGSDIYAEASRLAMLEYARHIKTENKELADEIRAWALEEKGISIAEEEAVIVGKVLVGKGC